MNNSESDSSLQNIGYIRLYTALVSLILSIYAFYTDDIINADGILYLNLAEIYINGGLAATQAVYDWPFYSILIAYIHQITSFSTTTSAALLNTLFFVILTDSLLLTSKKLIHNNRQLIIASILILCFYTVSEYRDFIVRDIGYWAFTILALYRFMLFIEKVTLTNASLWLTSAVVATLFRIEGLILLLTLPFYFLFSQHSQQSLGKSLRLGSIMIMSIAILGLLAENQTSLNNAFTKLNTINHYINTDRLLTVFNNKLNAIETHVLNEYSAEHSALILVIGLLAMLSYKLIKSISFGYITLYLIGRWQQKDARTNNPYRSFLLYFVAINIVILIVFMFKQYFITTRYAVTTSLGLLLLVIPSICRVIEHAWLVKHYKLLGLATIILVISLVDAMTQSNSKAYIKDTASWAGENLPQNSLVLTDDEFISHYFQPRNSISALCIGKLFKKNRFITNSKKHFNISQHCPDWKKSHYSDYDFLIAVEKRKNQALKQYLGNLNITRIYYQENKRGDRASVYRVNK